MAEVYSFINPCLPCHLNIWDELVSHYFGAGYTYDEITRILALRHDISCSIRTVQRILRRLNLHRNNHYGSNHDLNRFLHFLELELRGSGCNLGCRAMCRRMLTRYGLQLPRDVVLEGQRLLDAEGLEGRRRHRLRRRVYSNEGPNYAIHVDQHDKLRQYGFCIHGAMDGFSRRLLWLKVARTNRDPAVVASYFMDFLKDIQGIPRCIQMDRGTENTLIENMQVAFNDTYADQQQSPCVLYSSSPHNQRIERFWRTLFEMLVNFWKDRLTNLVQTGTLDCTSALHTECLRFSFMRLLQSELDEVRVEWNQHRTRSISNAGALPGKPDLMYFVPNIYGTRDFKIAVPLQEITAMKQEFTTPPRQSGCSIEFEASCQELMHTFNKALPSSFREGVTLFEWLLEKML